MASEQGSVCIHLVHSFVYLNVSNGWEGRLNLYVRDGADVSQAARFGTKTIVGYTSFANVLHNIPGDRIERWSGAWKRQPHLTGFRFIIDFDWAGREEHVEYYRKSVTLTSLHRAIPRDQPALKDGWRFGGQDYRLREVVARPWPSLL